MYGYVWRLQGVAVFSVYGGEVIEVLKILFAKFWKILYTDSIEGF